MRIPIFFTDSRKSAKGIEPNDLAVKIIGFVNAAELFKQGQVLSLTAAKLYHVAMHMDVFLVKLMHQQDALHQVHVQKNPKFLRISSSGIGQDLDCSKTAHAAFSFGQFEWLYKS